MYLNRVKQPDRRGKATLFAAVSKLVVYHFHNAAARAKAGAIARDVRNVHDLTKLVQAKLINPKLVRERAIKVSGYLRHPPKEKISKRIAMPFIVGESLVPEAVIALAQACPSGFRQPSSKAKNWASTSLVEQISIRAGESAPSQWEGSTRGNKKRAAQDLANRRTVAETTGYYHDDEGKAVEFDIDDKYLHSHERNRRIKLRQMKAGDQNEHDHEQRAA